ncbi:MAG: hypothetical protein RIT43_1665 [Bacteroidota bacterium]
MYRQLINNLLIIKNNHNVFNLKSNGLTSIFWFQYFTFSTETL